jgi:hypothetical protein
MALAGAASIESEAILANPNSPESLHEVLGVAARLHSHDWS